MCEGGGIWGAWRGSLQLVTACLLCAAAGCKGGESAGHCSVHHSLERGYAQRHGCACWFQILSLQSGDCSTCEAWQAWKWSWTLEPVLEAHEACFSLHFRLCFLQAGKSGCSRHLEPASEHG